MKKPAAKGGRKSSDTTDDHNLWHDTMHEVEPLKRGKPRVHASSEIAPPAKPATAPETKAKPKTKAPVAPPPAAPQPKAARKVEAPPLSDVDRRMVRKIGRGGREIEARIDLHGMRQHEAHDALAAFVKRCVGSGKRWVLVITGKGKAGEDDDSYGRERGVLRRNVPRWLDEPDLRRHVVGYTIAAIRHGGEGALYVHLRTRDRD